MDKIAEVCVNVPIQDLDKEFSYLIPANMVYLTAGWRVVVPFGNRVVEGFVVKVTAENSCRDGLREIIAAIDEEAWFDTAMLAAARWLSDTYICSLADAMRLFIPGSTSVHIEKHYEVNNSITNNIVAETCSAEQLEIWQYIEKCHKVKFNNIKKEFGAISESVLKFLISKDLVIASYTFDKTGKSITEKVVRLVSNYNNNDEQCNIDLSKRPAQKRMVELLIKRGLLSLKQCRDFKISRAVITSLVNKGIAEIIVVPLIRDSYRNFKEETNSILLTTDQQIALEQINKTIVEKEFATFLLHGVTGSGKTHVYIEAVRRARKLGRGAIVLVPEIGLTSQIVARFKAAFGDAVVVVHSQLSRGERFDSFQRLRQGSAQIVIGARSAVFAPVQNLGIIVVDEEHDFSYKQEDYPRYHAREAAIQRAKLAQGVCVLGSATPSMETYYTAVHSDSIRLLSLPSRIDNMALPQVKIIDMREELKQKRRNVISDELRALLVQTIGKNEQAILLLNRRGHSTFVMCRECGFVMRCNQCSVSLVYHEPKKKLCCHYCQRAFPLPEECPSCKSRYIRYFGTGTQKVEQEIANFLPQARVVRMDQDTTSRKFSHDRILSDFHCGKYDILLGTQMVAKGHDVANVTAVGIITADTGLNLPDFRAAERVFALLTQAAGRAGRRDKLGSVIIQTYNPEHFAIQAAQHHDYNSFYNQEILIRQELNYPPFQRLVKIVVSDHDEKCALKQAEIIALNLLKDLDNKQNTVIGPYSSAVMKVKGVYRINIIIKTPQPSSVAEWYRKSEIVKIGNVSVDVDPISVY